MAVTRLAARFVDHAGGSAFQARLAQLVPTAVEVDAGSEGKTKEPVS